MIKTGDLVREIDPDFPNEILIGIALERSRTASTPTFVDIIALSGHLDLNSMLKHSDCVYTSSERLQLDTVRKLAETDGVFIWRDEQWVRI